MRERERRRGGDHETIDQHFPRVPVRHRQCGERQAVQRAIRKDEQPLRRRRHSADRLTKARTRRPSVLARRHAGARTKAFTRSCSARRPGSTPCRSSVRVSNQACERWSPTKYASTAVSAGNAACTSSRDSAMRELAARLRRRAGSASAPRAAPALRRSGAGSRATSASSVLPLRMRRSRSTCSAVMLLAQPIGFLIARHGAGARRRARGGRPASARGSPRRREMLSRSPRDRAAIAPARSTSMRAS